MTKNKKILLSVLAVLVACAIFTAGYFVEAVFGGGKYSELEWMIEQIDAHYMELDENGNVRNFTAGDYINIIDNGTKLVSSNKGLLDRYSEYYTKSEYQSVLAGDNGNFFGVGVSLGGTVNDYNKIYSISFNSPLDKAVRKAGVNLIGKKIVKIGGVEITANNLKTELNKSAQGVEFELEVEGISTPIVVSRESYIESYVRYYDNASTVIFESEYGKKPVKKTITGAEKSGLDENTAYIELSAFNGNAVEEFALVMQTFAQKGKSKLILDLRNNGGGNMDILTNIASYLLKGTAKQKTVTRAKYKDGSYEDYVTQKNNYVPVSRLTVLANEGTASASECLIGALIVNGDLRRENLVITNDENAENAKTYGKGIMQTTFVSKKGTAIKLTTAYIYWPDKTTNIHNKGIIPLSQNAVLFENGFARALELNNA